MALTCLSTHDFKEPFIQQNTMLSSHMHHTLHRGSGSPLNRQIPGPVQGRRFGAAALRCVARVAKAAPDWGVIFFGYDWFAAYSAAAAANVAWDILIPHYKALLPVAVCLASQLSLAEWRSQCLLKPAEKNMQ